MKRLVLALAVSLGPSDALAQSSVHDFELRGSAVALDDACIQLTPDHPFTSGSAWLKRAIDLRQSFEIRLSIALGEKDDQGADGIVFVLHPIVQTGWRGEGMGFAGLVPSVGLEFDTYQNFHLGDPSDDHLALMVDGQRAHGSDRGRLIPLENLEDGARHPLRITWDAAEKRLTVVLDGRPRLSLVLDLVDDVFAGQSSVHWGFTAGTGRLSNEQYVCIEKLMLAAR